MSITQAAGGFYEINAVNQATLAVIPVTVGDYLLFGVKISTSAQTITAVSGGGVTTWTKLIGTTDATNSGREEIWGGVVTATGAATITATYSAAPGVSCDLWASELVWSGGRPQWSTAASGSLVNTASTTCTWPSLTSAGGDEAYWGFQRSAAGQTPSAGSSTGFTYSSVSTANGIALFNGTLAANTAFQPTCPVSTSNWTFATGVIIEASPLPRPLIVGQAVQRAATR